MKTLIGLIPDNEQAATAVEAIRRAGLDDCRVSTLSQPEEVWRQLGGSGRMRMVYRHVLYGALVGLAVALIYGLPASIIRCLYEGCAFSANLGLLIAISLFWIVSGAFMGAIIGIDRLEQGLYSYVEGVLRGGRLLILETPDEEAGAASEIMTHEGGLLVHSL